MSRASFHSLTVKDNSLVTADGDIVVQGFLIEDTNYFVFEVKSDDLHFLYAVDRSHGAIVATKAGRTHSEARRALMEELEIRTHES